MAQTLVFPTDQHHERYSVWIAFALQMMLIVSPFSRICREPYDTLAPGGAGIRCAPHLTGNMRLQTFTPNARQKPFFGDVIENGRMIADKHWVPQKEKPAAAAVGTSRAVRMVLRS